jgi:trimethylamine:corrinoid methyltransferase-like protein
MRRIVPRITVDLTGEDLDLIEACAARILDEAGLAIPVPAALQRLAGQPGLRVDGERVRFHQDDTLVLLHARRRPAPLTAEHHLRISAGGGALSILDHRTAQFRRPLRDDLLLTLRICDRLGLGGDPPVIPADIPMPLREIALYRLAWEHTQGFNGRDISSVAVGECVYEMAQAASKSFILPLYIISPLRVNAENLELILHFADRLTAASVGTMPMPGATAFLLAPGYLAQALAEAIGGYILLTKLLPQATVSFGATILTFDPYVGGVGCGSPESLLQAQMMVALLRRYGLVPGHYFWSMAGGCDAQAAAERMAGVLLGALAGMRHFGVAGRLQGEAFSLEQLLVDLEITAYVERILQGQAWSQMDSGWLTEIQEAVMEGSFLGSPGTAGHYRREIQHRDLFSHYTLNQRRDRSEPELRERIRRRLDELDGPTPAHLSPEARAEFDRIYRHAATHLR